MATVFEPNAPNAEFRRAELDQLRSKYLKRDRILGPAWLLILRLHSRIASGRPTEVCDVISIPHIAASTSQRCLEYLLATGVVCLAPGPGRRFRGVVMSPLTYEVLNAFLAKIDDADRVEREFCAQLSSEGVRI